MTGTDIDFLSSHTFSPKSLRRPRNRRGWFTSGLGTLIEMLRRPGNLVYDVEEPWSLRNRLRRSTSAYDVPMNHLERSTTTEKPWSKVYDVEETWSLRDRSTSGRATLVASRAASEVPWWVLVGSTNIDRFRGRSTNLESSRHPSPFSSTKVS